MDAPMSTPVPPLPPGATVNESGIRIDGIDFVINYSADSHNLQSSPSRFILPKTPEMVSAYYQLGERTRIRNVVDLSLIHISEPTRLLSISYAVFCLKKK